MISFEHQGWTVQIFASAAPARPLIVLPTFAEAVAPVREALADASDLPSSRSTDLTGRAIFRRGQRPPSAKTACPSLVAPTPRLRS